jgi:glucose-6-phosphate dehydrogenase assembly protein OpcA
MQTEMTEPPAPAGGVDLKAIEREMNAFWQELGKEDETGGVIRACVLNLVLYADSPAAARAADDVLIDVTPRHPSRALLLVADAASPEASVSAQVLSRCTLPTGQAKQVCCEQVTLRAAGAQVNELPSVVAPLLLADLPTFLCWFAPPAFSSRIFRRLGDFADRVVIDSARSAAPQADLAALARLLAEKPKLPAFSDLNWARLTPWRGLLAGFYDVSDYRPHLQRVDRVEIDYAPAGAHSAAVPPGALLVAGWLASRLGWQASAARVRESSTAIIFNRRDGGEVSVHFNRADAGADAQAALKRLSLAVGDGEAKFEVGQSAESHWLTTEVHLGTEHRPCHACSHEPDDAARLLANELEILGRDRVYEQAVAAAGAMIGALEGVQS